MNVKKTTLRCTLGDPAAVIWSIQGLPDGVSCMWSLEDVRRPAGEAYVVKKRGKSKTIRRFKTAAQAEAHAREWATAAMNRKVAR